MAKLVQIHPKKTKYEISLLKRLKKNTPLVLSREDAVKLIKELIEEKATLLKIVSKIHPVYNNEKEYKQEMKALESIKENMRAHKLFSQVNFQIDWK